MPTPTPTLAGGPRIPSAASCFRDLHRLQRWGHSSALSPPAAVTAVTAVAAVTRLQSHHKQLKGPTSPPQALNKRRTWQPDRKNTMASHYITMGDAVKAGAGMGHTCLGVCTCLARIALQAHVLRQLLKLRLGSKYKQMLQKSSTNPVLHGIFKS
eukprot:603850-Pelagomonas_calceolata.AAC.1